MIPITDLSWQSLSWQDQLSSSVRNGKDLTEALGIKVPELATDFPINVPLAYLNRIEPGNPMDPLLLQILARSEELDPTGVQSPLEEESFNLGHGMIQKYLGRALIVTTGACAINCRYCFRRHFPYEETQPSTEDWLQIFSRIATDSEIREIILSGGDPLMQSDKRLNWIFSQLNKIEHISTIRIHTRMPVVIPARVTRHLLQTLESSRPKVVIVNHVNHGNEIDEQVSRAMAHLHGIGATLLNQSVLLKGINDSLQTLSELSRRLHDSGILPYYLHLLDPVAGAMHFEVDEATGIDLISDMRDKLPGYLVPRLAREIPHRGSKTLIA